MITPSTHIKSHESEEIAAQIAEFERNGGKIQFCGIRKAADSNPILDESQKKTVKKRSQMRDDCDRAIMRLMGNINYGTIAYIKSRLTYSYDSIKKSVRRLYLSGALEKSTQANCLVWFGIPGRTPPPINQVREQAAIDAIRAAGRPIAADELSQAMHMNIGACREFLRSMAKKKLIYIDVQGRGKKTYYREATTQ